MSRRTTTHLAAICLLVATTLASAAPPGEVGPTLSFSADKQTQTWDPVAGATDYNLYRGTQQNGSDLGCLVFQTPATSAVDPDEPGQLFLYVVAAHNPDGEGTLGNASDGSPRTSSVACVDDDLDGVFDSLDNCLGVANPSQLDQNLNGLGDACDAGTYDFEDDTIGLRPGDVTQDGDTDSTFLVRDSFGDLGVSYDGGLDGVHDRFDRLAAWLPFQDLDVYLDSTSALGETLALELWSEGTGTENAGDGLRFHIEPDGSVLASRRDGAALTALGPAATLPDTERLRLRLRKGPGQTSTLFVDRDDAGTWIQETFFDVTDDHQLIGRGLAIVNQGNGRRPLLRITGVPVAPVADFVLNKSYDGLADWKLFQRGPAGHAPVPVQFSYRATADVRLEVRVVDLGTGLPLPGFDFADQSFTLPAAPGGAADSRTLLDVPEGGNYDLEARIVDPGTSNVLGSDTATNLAVGDVFLAAGQSNMSGYSGVLDPRESPVPEVHLFGNDYAWKQGSEPMDSGADQVDLVSAEGPVHSLMLRFAKEVSTAVGVPVAIIPAPLGGTNLFAQWQRNGADPGDRGTLYGSSIHRVLVQGFAHPIRGVLWYQGESDVGRGTALYLADLQQLVADYRADLGNPSLFFGNCQLATYAFSDQQGWIEIQEAQRRQAEADPLSALVALVDQPRSDAIHLSVAGYKEAGVRLAAAVLDGSYGIPSNLGPRLLSLQFSGGGGNRIALTYDKALLNGENVNLFRVTDQNGTVGVSSVQVSGDTITLRLANKPQGATTVSYGFGRDPGNLWAVAADGSGAALCFDGRPVQ
jgi:sialate O-acetylesterase